LIPTGPAIIRKVRVFDPAGGIIARFYAVVQWIV